MTVGQGRVQADCSIAAVGAAAKGGRSWTKVGAGRWSRSLGALLLLIAASPLAGCAPRVKLRVPPSAIAELPLERKLTLLDAENELLSAVDARDLLEERWLAAREAVDDAWTRKREADDARDRAKKGSLPLEVPEAAQRESLLRIEFARADLELARAQLRAGEGALLAAEAKYEQARAGEVIEAGLTGARGLRAPEFQEQSDRLAQVAQQRTAEAAKKKEAADTAAAEWKQARAELTKLTGGAQGSAWVQ